MIGHARVALSGVLTRLPSTQTNDTQRGEKSHTFILNVFRNITRFQNILTPLLPPMKKSSNVFWISDLYIKFEIISVITECKNEIIKFGRKYIAI